MMPTESETNKQFFIRTLREIAEFVESHPFDEDLPFSVPSFYLACEDSIQFGEAVKAAGSSEKDAFGGCLNATVKFGRYAQFQIYIYQEKVCKRVKIGTKIIPAKEQCVMLAEPERIEDVFEYQCPDSFLALAE